MLSRAGLVFAALALMLAFSPQARAIARPHHVHEDLFNEDDIQIGFKLGPQITGFTNYQQGNANIAVQSTYRFVAGAAMKFIYSLARFELDIMWNSRGWVNTQDTLNNLAFPFLIKFPVELEKGVDFEAGAGVEPEIVMVGANPHTNTMMGVLASVGLSVDFTTFVFDFEIRYNFGVSSVSDNYSGSHNRDLQPIAGVLWHF